MTCILAKYGAPTRIHQNTCQNVHVFYSDTSEYIRIHQNTPEYKIIEKQTTLNRKRQQPDVGEWAPGGPGENLVLPIQLVYIQYCSAQSHLITADTQHRSTVGSN